jgi:hypothetical protein
VARGGGQAGPGQSTEGAAAAAPGALARPGERATAPSLTSASATERPRARAISTHVPLETLPVPQGCAAAACVRVTGMALS